MLKRQGFALAGAWLLACTVSVQANPIPVVEVGSNEAATAAPVAAPSADSSPWSTPTTSPGDAVSRLLQQLEAMQQELGALRGQVEEQGHQLEQMKQQQRDRYLDLDRRLGALALQPQAAAAVNTPHANTAAAPAGAPAVAPATEQEAYQAAFALIRQREFDQAVTALEGFLKQYPQSDLTANALYWMGEVQLAQTHYAKAKQAFERVIKEHPQSGKMSDATYKLGRTLVQMGDTAEGKKWLQKTQDQYPDSSAARLAAEYITGIE